MLRYKRTALMEECLYNQCESLLYFYLKYTIPHCAYLCPGCKICSWGQCTAVRSGDGLTQSIQENKVGFIFENRTIYQVRSKALVLLR